MCRLAIVDSSVPRPGRKVIELDSTSMYWPCVLESLDMFAPQVCSKSLRLDRYPWIDRRQSDRATLRLCKNCVALYTYKAESYNAIEIDKKMLTIKNFS